MYIPFKIVVLTSSTELIPFICERIPNDVGVIQPLIDLGFQMLTEVVMNSSILRNTCRLHFSGRKKSQARNQNKAGNKKRFCVKFMEFYILPAYVFGVFKHRANLALYFTNSDKKIIFQSSFNEMLKCLNTRRILDRRGGTAHRMVCLLVCLIAVIVMMFTVMAVLM
jgi:hypothetical protein